MKPKKKETRGGARPGTGAKPKNGVAKVAKSVSTIPAHEAAILAHYGAKNLSQALEVIATNIT